MNPPLDPMVCAGFVMLAFVPAGVAHALWLRSQLAAPWRVSVDGGRSWRGKRLLGDNKTWAGFLILPPAAGIAFAGLRLATYSLPTSWRESLWQFSVPGYALLGLWTGLGFMAGELPNSFVKRQLSVAPGTPPAGRTGRMVSFLIDRIDSLVGALLAQAIAVPVDWRYAGYLVLVAPGIHWLFSALLYRLGVKGRRS
jgi:CDP-2,3-bis-(O-geranylgeranyl)-sn-glycerol synthase